MNVHDIEQQRADFEEWVVEQPTLMCLDGVWRRDPITGEYEYPVMEQAWRGYQAGRAALQSQYEIQFQVWRSTDSCMEFWSWDEADQYDYDQAKPENRRIIQIVKEG